MQDLDAQVEELQEEQKEIEARLQAKRKKQKEDLNALVKQRQAGVRSHESDEETNSPSSNVPSDAPPVVVSTSDDAPPLPPPRLTAEETDSPSNNVPSDAPPVVVSTSDAPPPPPPRLTAFPLSTAAERPNLSSTNVREEKEKAGKAGTGANLTAATHGATLLAAAPVAGTTVRTTAQLQTERIQFSPPRDNRIVDGEDTDHSAVYPPTRRRLLLVEQYEGDLLPRTAKILLLMENLLVMINVWRDSEFGQKILQERGILISAAERDEMNRQLDKLKPEMRLIERCIVNLFTTFKKGQDINAKQLLALLDDIKKSEDPSIKRFSNTIQNLLNDNTTANTICLPAALFRQRDSADHTVANIIYNLRLHIVYKHKFYFEKYDLSILGQASPNTSAQRASYNIQAELATYISDRAKLERKCSQLSPDHENVQELVMQIIAKHLGIAGSIPAWFKEDPYFAKTLDIIATFNKPIDDKSKNRPLEKSFLHNPLSAFNTTIFNERRDNRNPKERRHTLTVILLMISNYYLNTPLGKYFAERFGIDENTDFGQKDKIKKLKQLAERLAFDPQNDEDAIKQLIKEIKIIIKSIWSTNSRTKNELVLLVQYFGSEQDKKDLPKLVREDKRKRFCQTKEIFDYHIEQDDIDDFYKLYFTQELTKRLSYYHTVTSKRSRVTTANFKDQAMWQLEQALADIYNIAITGEDGVRARVSCLPAGYDRDLTGLIQYELHKIYQTAICRRAMAEQGEFSIAWHKLNVYFARMVAGKMQKKQLDDLRQQLAARQQGPAHSAAISVAPVPANSSVSNPDFYVLAARLLAIINAYSRTDLAVDMNLDLNYKGQGQIKYAETLANYAVQLFLQIKQNAHDRVAQEEAAKSNLIEGIKQISLLIKGNWLAGSPKSRFAKSLDELINSPVNLRTKSLPFNAEKSKKLFPDDNKIDAKRMIHRHVIERVCTHYLDFEQDIMGKYSDKPGDFKQKAVVATRRQLKTISHMSLREQETEIAKLGPSATVYNLVVDTMGKPIVQCGRIAGCFYEQPFYATIAAACNTLFNFLPADDNPKYLVTTVVPNQVEVRCLADAPIEDIHDRSQNMYRLLGSIHIICNYYLDENLGRQYADAVGFPHHKKHGWNDQVLQMLLLAKRLYVRKRNDGESDEDFVKNNMTQILREMNALITTIRKSFSKNSALANELITLVNKYGGHYQVNTPYRLTDKRYEEGKFLVDSSKLSQNKAEDFMQMCSIQEVATELAQLKNELDTGSGESEERASILQMEQNLDKLYKMTIDERRAEMARLLPPSQRNIANLIKKYIPTDVPYDFMSPNSYLKKTATNRPLKRIYKYLDYLQVPVVSAVNEVRQLVRVQ